MLIDLHRSSIDIVRGAASDRMCTSMSRDVHRAYELDVLLPLDQLLIDKQPSPNTSSFLDSHRAKPSIFLKSHFLLFIHPVFLRTDSTSKRDGGVVG